jgi:NarL family two-component system response regulator LiaR
MIDHMIRLLVVDDHTVVRKGLCSLLTSRYNIEVVGEAADGQEAIQQARDLLPDVILMDLVMPRKSGLEAILEIREENPAARILILTSFGDEAHVSTALRAGAQGYVLKDSSPDQLINAIHSVFLGNLLLPVDMARKVLPEFKAPLDPEVLNPQLTEREKDVLREIANGSSNQEIAQALSISTTTVRSHISSLFRKLDVTNRTQAALFAVEIGLGGEDTTG